MSEEAGGEDLRVASFPARSQILVGRRQEFAILQTARRALAQSRGSLVLVGGEAGIGKSRLVASFLRASGEGRLRNVVFTECLQNVRYPYGPLRSLLAKFASAVTLSAYSKRALRALVQLAPDALDPAIVSSYRGTSLDSGELFEALLELVTTISSRRATIFCVDDIHWADSSTLAALEYLASRISATRLMIVCTYRSEALEQEPDFYRSLATLSAGPVSQVIELKPLSAAEMSELIDFAAQGAPLTPLTKDTIQRRAEGNPFYAEELVKGAVDQQSGSPSSMPLSLRAGILHRTAALAADDRHILARAAVLGYRFTPATLAVVTGRTIDSLLPMLRRARAANLIVEEELPSTYSRFRHALTRQIIYDDLLGSERQLLHNQILTSLEALPEIENVYAELAYHAQVACDGPKTLRYNEKAGEAALAVGAKSQAAAHFASALNVAQDDSDRARLLEQLGNIAREESRLQDAIDIFERALDLRLARAEYVDAARLVVLMSAERTNAGESHVEVVAAIERFIAEYRPHLTIASRDHLVVFAARLMSAAQDLPEAGRFLRAVVAPADLSDRARQNFLTANLNAAMCSGDLAGWLTYAQQLRALLPSLPPFLHILALYVIAQTGCYLGASEEAEVAVREADELNKKWEFGGLATFGAAVATVHYWLRGELSDARRCVELVLERPDVTVAQTNLAHIGPLVAIALGDLALGGRCHPPHIMASARECEIPGDTAILLGVHGTWLAAGGRLEEARADLQTALTVMEHAMPSSVLLFAAAARWLPLDQLERIEQLASSGIEAANGVACSANAAFVAAIIAQRRRSDGLLSLADSAADGYHRLGWPLFEAQALEIAGRHEEAQSIFEQCGALGFMPQQRKIPVNGPSHTALSRRDGLSAREYEVANLVTLGSTNAVIADRLGVSTKTVEKHLSSIFAKLDVKSRAEIAAHIARGDADRAIDALAR